MLCSHCRQKNRLYKELWRCLWLIQGRQLRQHLGEYVFLRMPKLFTPLEATHVCAGVNGGVFFSLTFSLKVLLLRKSLRATMKGKANGENEVLNNVNESDWISKHKCSYGTMAIRLYCFLHLMRRKWTSCDVPQGVVKLKNPKFSSSWICIWIKQSSRALLAYMVWTERQEAELKILRFSLGVVRLGMIRN